MVTDTDERSLLVAKTTCLDSPIRGALREMNFFKKGFRLAGRSLSLTLPVENEVRVRNITIVNTKVAALILKLFGLDPSSIGNVTRGNSERSRPIIK